MQHSHRRTKRVKVGKGQWDYSVALGYFRNIEMNVNLLHELNEIKKALQSENFKDTLVDLEAIRPLTYDL